MSNSEYFREIYTISEFIKDLESIPHNWEVIIKLNEEDVYPEHFHNFRGYCKDLSLATTSYSSQGIVTVGDLLKTLNDTIKSKKIKDVNNIPLWVAQYGQQEDVLIEKIIPNEKLKLLTIHTCFLEDT